MLRKLILAALTLCAVAALFATQSASAQTVMDEPRYVAPSDGYVVVERRYEMRPAIGQQPLVERRVYEEPRPVPPAPIVTRRTYGVQSVIDNSDEGVRQCRIAVRQWTNEYGELMQRRVRVCE